MDHRRFLRSRAVGLFLVCLALPPDPGRCGEAVPRGSGAERVTGRESKQVRRAKKTSGIYHPLKEGQTLAALSRAYRIPVRTLLRVNGIKDPRSIPAGTPIFIPGARRILSIPGRTAPPLAWPLEGRIMTSFNVPGQRHHDGIDIDGEAGQIIRAAAPGRVIQAGREGLYGKAVLLDHGDDLTTFYAHASRILVKEGDRVERGEAIAEVGSTGNARGTHLHFEVRRKGRPTNPLPLLPTATTASLR